MQWGILPFSIPCESWGSATRPRPPARPLTTHFQYSLRIVGFRDLDRKAAEAFLEENFQYSLRIVGFRDLRRLTS